MSADKDRMVLTEAEFDAVLNALDRPARVVPAIAELADRASWMICSGCGWPIDNPAHELGCKS